MFLRVLITQEFWSKIGFFISYILTSLLVLEVLRLFYTDANKREVEKMLDSYTRTRSASRSQSVKVPLDDLPDIPSRRPHSPAATPGSERTLVGEQRRRRVASGSPPTFLPAQLPKDLQTPPRRLRKRSDTLNSAGSAESRGSVRRRREASPASAAGSKVSSRHASPTPRSKEEKKVAAGLQRMLRTKS